MTKAIAKWLALALSATLILSGCGLITVDKEKEQAQKDAQIVAEFNGGSVSYGEAMKEYENWASYYQMYGYNLTDENEIKDLKQQVLDTLVQQKVVEAKAKEMGLTELTADEKAALDEQATSEYEEAINYYTGYLEGDTEEETRQNAVDYLESIGYTLESIQQYNLSNAWQEKLKADITKDVTVSDADVQTAYEASVAEDQASYTEDNYNFENAATYGDTVTWVPEGYRAVKHILLTLSDDDAAALSDLQSQIEDVNIRIEEIQNPEAAAEGEEGDISAFNDAGAVDSTEAAAAAAAAEPEATDAAVEGAAVTAEPEDLAAAVEGAAATAEPEATADAVEDAAADEAVATGDEDFVDDSGLVEEDLTDEGTEDISALDNLTLPELEAKRTELTKQLDTLKAATLAKLQPKIDEIQVKINAGEDFEKLIEQYGEDDGMKTEPTKTNGYYVSATSQMWDDAFTTAAMALAKVGDVSSPVLGQSGVHIIKYVADVTPGPVPLETIKDVIRDQALDQAKSDLYDQTVNGWVQAAGAKTYVDRLVDQGAAG